MKIVLATSNKHKVQEINDIVNNSLPLLEERVGVRVGVRCQQVCDSGIEFILPPEGFDPVEDGETFEENSRIKALAAWEISKNWSLADDSGLCIKALGGKPGIHSARYAETPQKRIERVLNEMQGIKERDAEFVCAMTLVNPEGKVVFSCKGICEGSITEKPAGVNGFGYDPIFLVKGDKRTMAELSEEEKNQISHRSRALNQIVDYMKHNL